MIERVCIALVAMGIASCDGSSGSGNTDTAPVTDTSEETVGDTETDSVDSADSGAGDTAVDDVDTVISDSEVAPDSDASDADATADVPMVVGERPAFKGLAQALSEAPGELTLRWIHASDDATAEAEMRYLVFASDVAEVDTSLPPVAEVTGVEMAVVTGLTPGAERWVLVLAEDGDDNRSASTDPVLVRIADTALTVRQDVVDLREAEVTATSSTEFTVAAALVGDVDADSIVVLNNPSGRQLRRVLTKTVDGTTATLTTEKATLSDVFSAGTLDVTGRLPDLGTDVVPAANQLWVESNAPIRRASRDGSVTMSQSRPSSRRVELVPPREVPGKAVSTNLTSEVSLDYGVTFEPSVSSRIAWGDVLPTRIEVIARGTATFDVSAAYNLTGSAEYKVKKELFSRNVVLRYLVAGVPVYQEVTLTIFAELDMKAEGAFKADASFTASKTITAGFRWTESQGFETITDQGFERSSEFNVDGHATAKAKLRVYPVLSTSFYKSALFLLWVKPTIDLDAKVRFLPLPVEFERFNIVFFVDAEVGANASILGNILPEYRSGDKRLLTVPLFSLPEIDVRMLSSYLDTCGSRRGYARVSDGYNNAVDPANLSWEVTEGEGTVAVDPGNATATFSSTSAGTNTVQVSAYGDGFLGVLGTRYKTVTVDVSEAPPGDCDPANSEVPLAQQAGGCIDNGVGWINTPLPTKTMYGPGDIIGFEWDAFCEESRDGLLHTCHHGTGMGFARPERGLTLIWPLTWPDLGETASGLIEYRVPEGTAGVVDWSGVPPGDLVVYAGIVQNHGTSTCTTDCRHTAHFIDEATGGLMERRSHKSPFADPPINENCEGPTLLPQYVAKVPRDVGEEDNDEPEDAGEIDIEGPPVRSVHNGFNDRDFYQLTPEVEPHFGSVYDADAPYEPDCPVEVTAYNRYGQAVSPVAVYQTAADARAGVNALAWDTGGKPGLLVFDGAVGQTYYASVHDGSVSPSDNVVYEVKATSVCGWFDGVAPMLTAAPVFDRTNIALRETIHVDLAFTADVTRVVIRLLTDTLQSVGPSVSENVSGVTSLGLDFTTFNTPGDFILEVLLVRDVDGQMTRSTYRYNALAPAGTYAWQISHPTFFWTFHASGIPFQRITVTEE